MSRKTREADHLKGSRKGTVVEEEVAAAIQIISLSFPFLLDSRRMSIKAKSSFLAVLASS